MLILPIILLVTTGLADDVDMGNCRAVLDVTVICALLALAGPGFARGQERWRWVGPEQRRIEVRDPSCLPKARLPRLPAPLVVSGDRESASSENLTLDDAIRTALANSEVIRVLTGLSASSSGRTIYDPAIANTQIDQARARFDPTLSVGHDFSREGNPSAVFAGPNRAQFAATPTHDYLMNMGLSKTTRSGGTAGLNVNVAPSRAATDQWPLNPQTRSSVDLSFTQPLLQGAGARVNLAPVMIARIDTERSFFQMKDSVQQLLRGVIEAYWALVSARTDLWARQQQVEQGQHGYRRAEKKLAAGLGNAGDVAQARSALADFRAARVIAQANVLQREGALRDVLGLPPSNHGQLVPVTPPPTQRLDIDWDRVLLLAEDRRPDLIELKLLVEADEQRLLQARNLALPQVDATARYGFDGLGGRMPDGTMISSHPGQFTGWTLGVQVNVPLGLRESRAVMRQQELSLMRDRANLQQGLHNAAHELATSYRNLAQFYEQYLAFQEARSAAHANLDVQFRRYDVGLGRIYLDVLQAISSWGNAVSAESQALVSYNAELANLEVLMGTILDAHGVRFVEEGYRSMGPWGRLAHDRCYPRDRRPGPNAPHYENTSEPAENALNLADPLPKRRTPNVDRLRLEIPERIPAPVPQR